MLRVNFFYNQHINGFSETYFAPGDDPYTFVGNLTDPQLFAFIAWRSNATSIYAVRATQIGGNRISTTRLIRGGFRGSPLNSTTPSLPDVVSTDAVYRLFGVARKMRRVFFRGLRDDYVVRDGFGNDQPPAALSAGVNSCFMAMKDLGLSVQYQQRPPAGGLAMYPVTEFSADVVGVSRVQLKTTAAAVVAIQPGDRIVINNGPSKQGVQKLPRIATVSFASTIGATSMIQVIVPNISSLPVFPINMRIWKLVYAWDPINALAFERFSEHKTGRPIGLLRGRRTAVAV